MLVGVGGFGSLYIDMILKNSEHIQLVGAVDPNPIPPESLERLRKHGTIFYESMEDFYSKASADLCIVCSPIHFHMEQSICALKHGSNVLCEKPAAGCVHDVEEMIKAQGDKFVAVGFQHCFADNILNLKKDILDGVLGTPKMFKTITFLPRSIKYFNDRKWAGEIMSKDKKMIADSIVNNACAHNLQVLLFLLGDKITTAAFPETAKMKLYNANNLKTFDSIALKLNTKSGVPIFYYASHSVEKKHGHEFELFFEHGSVRYLEEEKLLQGRFNNGDIKDYGWSQYNEDKLHKCIMAVQGKKDMISCNLETALPHAHAIEMIMSHLDETYAFSSNEVKTFTKNGDSYIYVPGMFELLTDAYRQNILPNANSW